MKYIKTYEAFGIFKKIGDFFSGKDPNAPKFPTDPEIIDGVCKKYNIRDYTINEDGTVDVNRHVDFEYCEDFDVLPLKFGTVRGSFSVNGKKITDLEGFPKSVEGNLFIHDNKNLKSLEGCTENVGVRFVLSGSPLITSLEGCPKSVGESFAVSGLAIKNLIGSPQSIHGEFSCADNKKLTSLEGSPERIYGLFSLDDCDVRSFVGSPQYIRGIITCIGNHKLYDPEGLRDMDFGETHIHTYLHADPFNYKLPDDPKCDIDYINSRAKSENYSLGRNRKRIQPTPPPIAHVMKLFRTFEDFLMSLDYDYIQFQGGQWVIIEWKLREAFSEFDLPSEQLIEYFKKTKYAVGELGYKLI